MCFLATCMSSLENIYIYVFQVIILYTFHLYPIVWLLPSNKAGNRFKKAIYRDKNFCKCKGKNDKNNSNGSLKYISQLLILEMVIWAKFNGEKMEVVTDFIFFGSKIPVDTDGSHEIKRHLLPWKKSFDKPRQHIKKQRYHFANKSPYSQSCVFSCGHVRMWELNHKESCVHAC